MKVKQTALVRIDDELDVPQVLNELHVCCEDVIDAAHNVDVVDKCVDTNTSAECWIRCQRVDGRLEIQTKQESAERVSLSHSVGRRNEALLAHRALALWYEHSRL